MTVMLALKTMAAIESAIEQDQGGKFRQFLGQIIPHMADAYRGVDEGFRTHLGASLIGGECSREIWYGFRWVKKPKFSGRILRLFNRGHLEEARFIAMLLTIGCQVWQQDEHGKQYRISDAGGHFGGSTDGIAMGIPDLPADVPALTEFKTHGEKSFEKLKKEGVRSAKFEHFVQMQVYMRKLGLMYGLYMAVNKNTDEVYAEIIHLDTNCADHHIDRGINLVFAREAPARISNTPGWFKCKFCDHRSLCHGLGDTPDINCRTCTYAWPREDGQWHCNYHDGAIPKETQLTGCPSWIRNPSI